jgi:glucosamine-6-phosphate deaminase
MSGVTPLSRFVRQGNEASMNSDRQYADKDGRTMTRQEVHQLPVEALAERSPVPMHVLPDRDALYDAIADVMIESIEARKGAKTTMILPVGPVGQYPVFAAKVARRGVDCRNLWTFNMDEFLDRNGRTVPETHLMSFKGEMMRELYERLPVTQRMPLEQMFFPRHDNLDTIDRALDEHAPDGVDLCLAGVGPEGHFAFNEDPNFGHVEVSEEEFLEDRTRLVLVNTSTVDMDALVASCGNRSAVPPFAVTLGPHDVLRARRTEVVFFAGRFQRFALREVLFRQPTMRFPGTLLKLRKEVDGRLVPQDLRVWATPDEAGSVTARTI